MKLASDYASAEPSTTEDVVGNRSLHFENRLENVFYDYIRFPQCKRLINRILSAQDEGNIKSIVMLSQLPGEGKTMLTAIIALGYMRHMGKRVLIIDTVSRTREDSFFFREILNSAELPADEFYSTSSLVDLITTQSIKAVPQFSTDSCSTSASPTFDTHTPLPYNSAVPSLRVSADGYQGIDFQVTPFIDTIKSTYDLVLIDTCALSQVNNDSFDPIILAQHADASVVVTSPLSFAGDHLRTLTKELRRHKISPLGLISNPGASHGI